MISFGTFRRSGHRRITRLFVARLSDPTCRDHPSGNCPLPPSPLPVRSPAAWSFGR